MEISVNKLHFLCMFILCKAAEIPNMYSARESPSSAENSHSESSSILQESNEFRFYKKNDNSTSSLIPPHTNTKWSPWIPIPHGHSLKDNSLIQKGNTLNASMENSGNDYIGNNSINNKTDVEFALSNATLNETLLNKTNQTDTPSTNNNKQSYFVTPSSETTKSLSNMRHTKTRVPYAKGITYYFWDTVFLILKCFKDHWKTGIVDCMTARASTALGDLLGIGGTRRQQILNKGGFQLMPYDEILVESPRNEEELPLDDDEEEEEEEVYDDEATDSREARRKKINSKKLKGKRIYKLLHIVVSTALMALPVITALKLKFFMMLSVGIAALSLVSGKALILSMVSFVLAIVAILKKAAHRGYYISRMDDFSNYPPYAGRKALEDVYSSGSAHTNYFM